MDKQALGRYAKNKGKRGEREIARLLKAHGFDNARRTSQYCGKTGDASDVVGLPGYHVEVKYVEKLNIWKAVEQAANDAKEHWDRNHEYVEPVVFYRKKGIDWRVSVDAEHFLDLVKAANAYFEMKAGVKDEGTNRG